MTNAEKIRQQLEASAENISLARDHIDPATEYLEEDLEKLHVTLLELKTKMDRDQALQRDREAFAEPPVGLKEWIDNG